MYSLGNYFGRILRASALAIVCMAPSGCFHLVGSAEYDRLKVAEEHYSTVCKSNVELKFQNEQKDKAINFLADLNKEAVKLAEGKKKELTEQARLEYERDIEELRTDKIRLQRDRAFLEKHVAGFEKARTDFRTSDGEYLGLKERAARLENEVIDYRIKSEEDKRRIQLLERDNPEVQRLKEVNGLLEVQNSKYRTELDRLKGN